LDYALTVTVGTDTAQKSAGSLLNVSHTAKLKKNTETRKKEEPIIGIMKDSGEWENRKAGGKEK